MLIGCRFAINRLTELSLVGVAYIKNYQIKGGKAAPSVTILLFIHCKIKIILKIQNLFLKNLK